MVAARTRAPGLKTCEDVIPGRCEESNLRRAMARWGLSRFRLWSFGPGRNDKACLFRPPLQPGPLRQQHRPLHDVLLELIVGDVVLGALDPAAHRDTGFMHGLATA